MPAKCQQNANKMIMRGNYGTTKIAKNILSLIY